MRLLRSSISECLLCSAVLVFCCASGCTSSAQAPRIDKIDPPGWWAGLPDPMLLVQGENLNGARFTLTGEGVTLTRTQASDNGHWAFLWLSTSNAAPQTLGVIARNGQGDAQNTFVLAARANDPGAHRGFSSADVLYLIMTDRFANGNLGRDKAGYDRVAPRGRHGGDLAGVAQHLDYLHELGVTALWTTPVASNGSMQDSYHGYAATDLYDVDPHFGTLEDFRRLSNALHAEGMKLVIDLVPNHLGVKHPWVLDPPAPGWFHGTLLQHSGAKHDFYQLVDPHAPRQAWRDITTGWFTDTMPDLNQENPLVSQYMIENALWWVETANLDGIRLDTFPYVGRGFWHDFHAALHAVYPHLTTVGEVFNRDPEITSFFAGGVEHGGIDTGLDTPFDFPLYFTLRDVLYPHPDRLVTFIGNHDTTRFITAAKGSVPTLKLALGLNLTLRGMPQIYSGDEIAMGGGEDPDNRHDFPGGFAGDAHNAFAQAGRTATEEEVFAWTAAMLAMRAAHPVLQTGMEQDLFADKDSFVFVRSTDGLGCAQDHRNERLLIVVNKAQQSRPVELPTEDTSLAGCTEFQTLKPAVGAEPNFSGSKLLLQELAETMTVYMVR